MTNYSIVGHDGQPMTNQEVAAELALNRISGWTPQQIVGQFSQIVGQFPMIMRAAQQNPTNPASGVLMQLANRGNLAQTMPFHASAPPFQMLPLASQLTPPGVPGPQVIDAHPGPVGLSLVPMNNTTAIAAAGNATIVVQPQSIFKPYRLTVDPVIAAFFLINSLQVGVTPLFDAPGAVPASNFPPNLQQGNLKKITATPGLAITMNVTNRDGVGHPFFSTMFGEAAPTQCG